MPRSTVLDIPQEEPAQMLAARRRARDGSRLVDCRRNFLPNSLLCPTSEVSQQWGPRRSGVPCVPKLALPSTRPPYPAVRCGWAQAHSDCGRALVLALQCVRGCRGVSQGDLGRGARRRRAARPARAPYGAAPHAAAVAGGVAQSHSAWPPGRCSTAWERAKPTSGSRTCSKP
jgi:hypothetical protein